MYCMKSISKMLEKIRMEDYIKENEKCPKCNSVLHIDHEKKMFTCTKCKNGGLITDFLESKEKITFKEAIEQIAVKENFELEECVVHNNRHMTEKCHKCEYGGIVTRCINRGEK